MKITGGCHCGQIRYEAEIEPENAGICHCTDCQILSGSAFRTIVLTREDGFRFLKGEPRIYVKTGESGAERQQSFCGTCGSPIFSASTSDGPKQYSIRLGTVDQKSQLPPRFELWCRSAQSWLPSMESTSKREKQ